MEENKITPEEKLLKIIENPDVQKKKHDPPLFIKKNSFSFKMLQERIKSIRLDWKTLKAIDLRAAIKALAAVSALFTLFCIFNFAATRISLNKKYDRLVAESSGAQAQMAKLPDADVDMNNLIAQIRKRNIFSFSPPKAEAAASVAQPPANVAIYKLVGIIWSDHPQAMLESGKDQKTYFVSEGETLNGVTVKKILRDKVILGADTQEWEVR